MTNEIGDFDCYSDVYKSVYGIRPHRPDWKTESDYHADMDYLQEVIWEEEASEAERDAANAAAYAAAFKPAPNPTLADLWPV